jgi:hypothetical protein
LISPDSNQITGGGDEILRFKKSPGFPEDIEVYHIDDRLSSTKDPVNNKGALSEVQYRESTCKN